MSKKYEIIEDSNLILFNEKTLHRIRALRDIPMHNVKAGDFGGWIEMEHNLRQDGDCWVDKDAYVFDLAIVEINALISGHAVVSEHSVVTDNAKIVDHARVCDHAQIYNNVFMAGHSTAYGNSTIQGQVSMWDKSCVCGGLVNGINLVLKLNACICETADIRMGFGTIGANAYIRSSRDLLTIGPIGSRDDHTTFYKDRDGKIMVCCGCFDDTMEAFEAKVLKTHGENLYAREYNAAIAFAKSVMLDPER